MSRASSPAVAAVVRQRALERRPRLALRVRHHRAVAVLPFQVHAQGAGDAAGPGGGLDHHPLHVYRGVGAGEGVPARRSGEVKIATRITPLLWMDENGSSQTEDTSDKITPLTEYVLAKEKPKTKISRGSRFEAAQAGT
jgi:hypothetical protein